MGPHGDRETFSSVPAFGESDITALSPHWAQGQARGPVEIGHFYLFLCFPFFFFFSLLRKIIYLAASPLGAGCICEARKFLVRAEDQTGRARAGGM